MPAIGLADLTPLRRLTSAVSARSLKGDQRDWEALARSDALWAVHRGREQGASGAEEEFFASGARDVADVLSWGERHGLPRRNRTALDFGCGVGRLSRALAPRFERVLALDISCAMLDRARRMNAELGNVDFRLNESRQLEQVESRSIDLVLSLIVLQHVSDSSIARGYLAELARVLAEGGLLAVQMPVSVPWEEGWHPSRAAYQLVRRAAGHRAVRGPLARRAMHMGALTAEEVTQALAAGGGQVLEVAADWRTGTDAFPSRLYLATR
jgi:SAM-dependent methyltransferase